MRIEIDYLDAVEIQSPRIREKLLVLAGKVRAHNGHLMPPSRQTSRQVIHDLDRPAELDRWHKAQRKVTDLHSRESPTPCRYAERQLFPIAARPSLWHERSLRFCSTRLAARQIVPHRPGDARICLFHGRPHV